MGHGWGFLPIFDVGFYQATNAEGERVTRLNAQSASCAKNARVAQILAYLARFRNTGFEERLSDLFAQLLLTLRLLHNFRQMSVPAMFMD
jgi:hypothetical protein